MTEVKEIPSMDESTKYGYNGAQKSQPHFCPGVTSGLRPWAHCMLRVMGCAPCEDRGKLYGLPQRVGLTCPLCGLGQLQWGETATGGLRKERPHSLRSNNVTPQGTTGKNLPSLVLPQHFHMLNINVRS